MLVIIDYGIGNLRSIEKAFQSVGSDVKRTDKAEDIAKAERVVLPGVGAFGACAAEIRRRGLVAPVMEAIASGKPFLGVCVGMQLLFEMGEEMGRHEGLGYLPGKVVRFSGEMAAEPAGASLKVPHMGWNTITAHRSDPLLEGIEPNAYFYFVHSFHAAPQNPDDVLASTHYGVDFPAIVQRNMVYGVQFHPEKSQRNGLRILNNFANLRR
jgi:imidazole glycerol-phosphate synthase subunit HisH